jgi:hypothetical protein
MAMLMNVVLYTVSATILVLYDSKYRLQLALSSDMKQLRDDTAKSLRYLVSDMTL